MAYLNPANTGVSLPQLPLGPLTGFLTGLKVDTGNEMDKRMMRDDDLEYAINQIRQQQDQSNLDLLKANNANAMSGAAITAGQYADGTQQSLADTGAQAKIAGNQQSAIQSQDQIRAAVAPDVVRMGEYIKAKGGALDPKDQSDIDTYNQFAGVMKQHGITVPAFPDQGDAMQLQQWAANAAKYVQANSTAYTNTIPFHQKMAEIGAQTKSAETIEAARAASAETVGAGHDVAHVKGAEVAANAGVLKAELARGAAEKWNGMYEMMKQRILNRDDKTVHPDEVQLLQTAAQEAEFNNPTYELSKAMAGGDPVKLDQLRQYTNQVAEKKLQSLPGYTAAEAKLTGQQVRQSITNPQAAGSGTPRNLTLSHGQSLPSDLKPGDIVNGHVYKGGPSTDPKSWQ